ncbi:hypothetical protein BRADI_3g13510v3 [Brachypodium distachyon]|uniref:Uncharacterized protein n=1 Tax=Brachypodium distachyon TaxID=15368 RepID=I1I0F0_BRADI|nr:hypothetical protein BRADI_3g13510v3 [Brachypodium distachyon]
MDIQGQGSGASAAQLEEKEGDSLITEILAIAPAESDDSTYVECLISWVGDDIDRGDYYGPGKVRIGPFHRLQDPSEQSADMMEKEKKRVLHGLLTRNEKARGQELRSHLEAMERLVPYARQRYSSSFSWMTSKEFAGMLLVDGFFLYSRFISRGDDDDITVDRDIMFLLENQIPFFVLDKIHQLLTGPGQVHEYYSSHFVLEKVAKRVQRVLQRNAYIATTNVTSPAAPPYHLLHVLYMYLAPAAILGSDSIGIKVNSAPVPENRRWRRATEYYAAGVGFVNRELDGGNNGARSILDVDLIKDQLHIPRLIIDGNTFRMLRNMVALEQKGMQYSTRNSHVTAYCFFLSQVAGTEEDVELLFSKGIIVHMLRSNSDVTKGLAGLCDGVTIEDAFGRDANNYLRSKKDALEKLCDTTWRRYMAWLRMRNVKCWKALAVVAAAVVSIAIVLRLVFAGISYGRGK